MYFKKMTNEVFLNDSKNCLMNPNSYSINEMTIDTVDVNNYIVLILNDVKLDLSLYNRFHKSIFDSASGFCFFL